MAGVQNKRNSPGAFRSCLIPYKDQIFTWWFDDRKSAREIQALLAEQFGVEVHWSTITRFIKVRSRKADPHEKPAHLMTFAKETSSSHISFPSDPHLIFRFLQNPCRKLTQTTKIGTRKANGFCKY